MVVSLRLVLMLWLCVPDDPGMRRTQSSIRLLEVTFCCFKSFVLICSLFHLQLQQHVVTLLKANKQTSETSTFLSNVFY